MDARKAGYKALFVWITMNRKGFDVSGGEHGKIV
jgi:hypothetical protein